MYKLRMESSSSIKKRTFFLGKITGTGTKSFQFIEIHDHHLIAAGVEDNLNTVFYSG